MKYLINIKKIFNKNKIKILFLFIFIFFILRIIPHWEILWNLLILDSVSWNSFFDELGYRTIGVLFDLGFWNSFLAIVFPILISINIILFKELYQKQKFILKSKGFFGSISGIFFGLFGVGCAACSGLLLAPLISFLGLGWVFKILPYGGEELAYLGLILVLFSNIYLLKKIYEPTICKV